MASREVIVRLRAEVDQYMANMKRAGVQTEQFGKTTKTTGADLDRFIDKAAASSKKMGEVGKKLTTNLSLPLAAVGVAAGKLSLDFEASFSRMQGLAGVSAEEVDGLKASVLDLAGEVGKGPQELADALYFVRSAGLDGTAAMEALEMSAKGAAAGLGQTAQVADAVTSAMNGYGAEVLSAAEATDVLVATAREGKAEASQLAPQFGRLIPIAAELGITFDQVGAGMAFLSRASGDASLSATQLDGVMQKLIKPSQQGAAALAAVGMSTDTIRKSIREQGLLSTLEVLRDQLGDTGFVKFFDDVQGLQGALQLTGAQADEARGVFDALAESAGATDDAFARWADTVGFKNKKAFAELQTALIQLGDELAPLVGKVADFASALLGWFSALDDGSKAMVVTFGIAVAALGPALTVASRLTVAVRALGDAYAWAKIQAGLFATGGLAAMSLAAPAAIAALVAVGAAVNAYGREVREAKRDAEDWAGSFAGTFDPAKATMAELTAEIGRLQGAADEMQGHANNALNPFLDDRLKTARDNLRETAAPLEEIAAAATELQDKLGISADEALRMATNQGLMEGEIRTATGAIDEEAAATALATQRLQGYMNALSALFDPLFGAQDATLALKAAQETAAKVTAAHGAGSVEAAEANRELTRAALANEQAMLRLAAGIEAGEVPLDESIATLNRWVDQGIITRKAADEQIWGFTVLANKANEVPDDVGITVTADTDTAMTALGGLDEYIRTHWTGRAIPLPISIGQRPTGGWPVQYPSAGGRINPIYRADGGWTPRGTDTVPAMLTPGEYVINAHAAKQIGYGTLDQLNSGAMPMGGTTIVNHVTVSAGSIVGDHSELVRVVKRGLDEAARLTAA